MVWAMKLLKRFTKKALSIIISDLYDLHLHSEELKKMGRFGEKSINNMLEGIEVSKQMPFDRVLFGLGDSLRGGYGCQKAGYSF